MSTTLDELLSNYPALMRNLVPAIERAGGLSTHPIVTRLRSGGMIQAYVMRVFDNLMASAQGVEGFDRLVRKLAEASDARTFWNAVTELTVVSRLVRLGGRNVGIVPTADRGRPDSVGTLAGHRVYFEVTSLRSVNPRQRAQNDRLAQLGKSVEAIDSRFWVTFLPAGEYDDAAIGVITATIRRTLADLAAGGKLASGEVETFTVAAPPFGMWVSSKEEREATRPGTRFRLSGEQVLDSTDRLDEGKLLDTIAKKYRQCITGALNVIVIHTVSDGLDEAAQRMEFLLQSPRPHLTAVVLLSPWGGRSRVVPNPGASPAMPPMLLEELLVFCRIDDNMWTLGAVVPG